METSVSLDREEHALSTSPPAI